MKTLHEVLAPLGRPMAGHTREAARIAAVVALHPLGLADRAVEAAVVSLSASQPSKVRPVASGTPVLLVHGCGANKSSWVALTAHLRRAGYAHIETMNYSPVGSTIDSVARRLVRRVHDVCERTGSAKVHLVGHSLGGIVVRYAVTELGLETHTAAAVTIASPHGGATLATVARVGDRCGLVNAAAEIAPGAELLARLDRNARASHVRWTAYYSNLDLVVPAKVARLRVAALAARNILVPDAGHIGLLLDRRLLRSISTELRAIDLPDPPEPAQAA